MFEKWISEYLSVMFAPRIATQFVIIFCLLQVKFWCKRFKTWRSFITFINHQLIYELMKRRELEDMNCCQQMCSFIFSDQLEHLTTKHIIRIRIIIIIREQRDARPGTDSTNTSEISQSDLKTNEGTENAVRSRWDCGVRTSSSVFRFWDMSWTCFKDFHSNCGADVMKLKYVEVVSNFWTGCDVLIREQLPFIFL